VRLHACSAPFEKGAPNHRYCSETCRLRARNERGKAAGAWEYPRRRKRRIHREVAEQIYREEHRGEEMPPNWVGHHTNGDPFDFRREMIEPMSRGRHNALHAASRRANDRLARRCERIRGEGGRHMRPRRSDSWSTMAGVRRRSKGARHDGRHLRRAQRSI
jgi:hypothetical protein